MVGDWKESRQGVREYCDFQFLFCACGGTRRTTWKVLLAARGSRPCSATAFFLNGTVLKSRIIIIRESPVHDGGIANLSFSRVRRVVGNGVPTVFAVIAQAVVNCTRTILLELRSTEVRSMGNSVRLVRLLIVIIGSGWFAFIALGKEPTLDQTSNPNILDEFAIEPDGDRPTVSVDIGGRSCLFVVDTGLSMTTFDSRLRRHPVAP